MKAIIVCLLLGLSFSYSDIGAINYALRYCNNYNPKYNSYKGTEKEESANFVSQCISIGGGQDLSGCEGLDDKGMIPKISDLKRCLISKGWKIGAKISTGDPLFLRTGSYAMIFTGFDNKRLMIKFSSHSPDRCDGVTSVSSVEGYHI